MFNQFEIPTSLSEQIKSFIGPDEIGSNNEIMTGIYFDVIKTDKTIDPGTKILYLERAMSCHYHQFNLFLDKLYKTHPKNHSNNIELVRAFKFINDLYFDEKIKNGEYGLSSALKHFFGRVGYDEKNLFMMMKTYHFMKKLIREGIDQITLSDKNFKEQQEARISLEKSTSPNTNWRRLLDLPESQQILNRPKNHFFSNLSHYQEYIKVGFFVLGLIAFQIGIMAVYLYILSRLDDEQRKLIHKNLFPSGHENRLPFGMTPGRF